MRILHITVNNMRNFDIIIIAAANLCGAGLYMYLHIMMKMCVLLFPTAYYVCTTQVYVLLK